MAIVSNRLASAASPYLRQHADNPVDWWPWGPDALAEAAKRDVPVFVSIGYSACHWCHVMAHESFEDSITAAQMNQQFVCVKVDREERPDVDAVYMEACLAMTGSGGWPMSVFTLPDGRPFFAGTYFPKSASHGRPSFVQLLDAISDAWNGRRDELEEQAAELTSAVHQRSTIEVHHDHAHSLGNSTIDLAQKELASSFDSEWGGFGGAPKFPQCSILELALRTSSRNPSAINIVTTTLDAMAAGGIHDHLGGGFARYSVDRKWLVPHFEKMLYDQAQLLAIYTEAFAELRRDDWRQVVEDLVHYVHRDLLQPSGGVACAEDADSEGVEGKFYVWTYAELAQSLSPTELGLAQSWFGVSATGNFEGNNILFRPERGRVVRTAEVDVLRSKLFAIRQQRVRPGLDDKVLTEWNAMWVAALARAGSVFGRTDWVSAAESNAEFLWSTMRTDTGRWLRTWQAETGARQSAFADDHVWLIDAAARLYEATGRQLWLERACEVADVLLGHFADVNDGGLFTTPDDGELLAVRRRDANDGATPSANGHGSFALLRLAMLTGNDRFRSAAEQIVGLLSAGIAHRPTAFARSMSTVDLLVGPSREVVITGIGETRNDLLRIAHEKVGLRGVVAWGEGFGPLWEGRDPSVTAGYVCANFACQLPTSDPQVLRSQLSTIP